MLTILDELPRRFLEIDSRHLHEVMDGPTLIHLSGRRKPPLFVSTLLHGNEDSGFKAIQSLLKEYEGRELPRALSIFIGNIAAAREGMRRLQDQPDYNRIWVGSSLPEHAMVQQVVDEMRARGVFASVDIHNNTGLNPHYACVNRLEDQFLQLATLFGRTVVYFIRPEGVQSAAFAHLCPAVTLECGKAGGTYGVEHAYRYLEACLNLAEIPTHPVAAGDIDLFHTVAIVKVPENASLGFDEHYDIQLIEDLEQMNFSELPTETTLGWVHSDQSVRLEAWDERGREVGDRYFTYDNNQIRTALPVMPSMLTLDTTVIRQDCMCYLMERIRQE